MWTCYRVYLEAKAPMHIGYGAKLGIVDRTRYYVPAKNIWGALTNLIAKSVIRSYNPKIYQEVGKKLNESIKFSYLYPIKYERNSGEIKVLQVFAPYYTEDGLKFGVCKNKEKFSLEEFEQMFISSFVSTALDKTLKSAEEGSLHEIEFIRDKIKQDGKVKPTIFMGYFFVKDILLKFEVEGNEVEISFTNFIEVNRVELNEIWIGGERNYGFGRAKATLEKFNDKKINLFNSGMLIDATGEQLIVSCEDEHQIALSHVSIENLSTKLVRGDIEPLIGREWGEKGSGQEISQTAKICITPGSRFVTDVNISIGDFGVWSST